MQRVGWAIKLASVPVRTYIILVIRAFWFAVFVAAVALFAELLFVFIMGTMGHRVYFTSFGSLALFTGMMGFLPVQPSPSRISKTPLNIIGRAILLVEFTTFVAIAMFASARFMAWRHLIVPIEIWFAAYAYGLLLIVMLIANFGRLRREISTSK